MNYMQNPYQQNPYQQGETLIPVRGDDDVIRYPIAPGNSVSFRSVTEPFIYTKTLTSQFAQPIVEKYKLVKETAQPESQKEYALKSDLETLAAMVKKLMEVNKDE